MNVAIIGGGAAGFFSAITVKENFPDARVTIFEKTNQVLSKVKISGGGRCNVTNACDSVAELCKAYPRGGRELKKAFYVFNNKHAMEWFEKRGVPLTIQDDKCVFPKSQDSQTIIDCFLSETNRLGIEIKTSYSVTSLIHENEVFKIDFLGENQKSQVFDKVIVTTGGSPKIQGLEWIENLNHNIEFPVPSLFSLNIPDDLITDLMGIVVENVLVRIQGTKIKSEGALLITHWGMSGPAILKLSSFGARELFDLNYETKIQINWMNEVNNDIVYHELLKIAEENPNKLITNNHPYSIPSRLWIYFLEKCDLNPEKKWIEHGKKGLNKLTNILCNDEYKVKGKAKFTDEYVTCGGVSLQSVNMNTMESNTCKGLYFAGEVLDIDGVTGGFNFQAAWTTAFIAGKLG